VISSSAVLEHELVVYSYRQARVLPSVLADNNSSVAFYNIVGQMHMTDYSETLLIAHVNVPFDRDRWIKQVQGS